MNKCRELRCNSMSGVIFRTAFLLIIPLGFVSDSGIRKEDNVYWMEERPRPLSDAARILGELYRKPVTYEESILTWNGDVASLPGDKRWYPRRRNFVMHVDKKIDSSVLEFNQLNRIVDAYNAQNESPTFRTESSTLGLHILPDRARNSRGNPENALSLLDYHINVPPSIRTPSEHFEAICQAVTAVAGIKLNANPNWMDQYFAPNGIVPPRLITEDIKAQIGFEWGAFNEVARDALIDLLNGSASTLTWQLLCDSELCYLNLLTIDVVNEKSDRTPLLWDRKKVKVDNERAR